MQKHFFKKSSNSLTLGPVTLTITNILNESTIAESFQGNCKISYNFKAFSGIFMVKKQTKEIKRY